MTRITEQYKAEVAGNLIKALERGCALWQKEWSCDFIPGLPVNAVTGKYYRGRSSIILWYEAEKLSSNEDDLRWATNRQAESKGWSIKPGSRPVRISIMIIPKKEDDEKKQAIINTFNVFHASQIQGIPKLMKRKVKRVMRNKEIEKIIVNSSARIFEGGFEPAYSPKDDLITIPPKSAFDGTEGYYSNLLHELAHWTGHHSRLFRFYSWNLANKVEHAREELVAEIASMFLSAAVGIPQTQEHFTNHAAYISSWISLLRSDPEEIFRAAREASKATDFILKFGEESKIEDKKVV